MVKKNACVFISGYGSNLRSLINNSRNQNFPINIRLVVSNKINAKGILYAKKKWLEELPPYQGGGGMIGEVKKKGISYGDLPNKYEAGTMATAQVIAFNESIKFLEKIGIENIEKHEKDLLNYAIEVLKKNNSINIIGNPKNKGGVICVKKIWLVTGFQISNAILKKVPTQRPA